MTKITFSVTYEIVTPESAEDGDFAVEADECPVHAPRWITVTNGLEYESGAFESRSLHIPESVTVASRMRLARYLGCYGV